MHRSVLTPPDRTSWSDDVLQSAQLGDRASRAVLLDTFGGLVFRMCRRWAPEPEDAYQDAWVHVLQRLDKFDPRGRASFRTWLATVVRHRLADRHKARGYRGAVVPSDDNQVAHDPDPERLAHARRQLARLDAALEELPAAQRRVVVRHHARGQSLASLAAEEGVKIGTIKSRLHRARAHLVDRLEKE